MKTSVIECGRAQGKRYFEIDTQELTEILIEFIKKSGSGYEGISASDFQLDCEVVGHWNYLQNVTLMPKESEE